MTKKKKNQKHTCIQVHKYLNTDAIFVIMPLFTSTVDLRFNNQDVTEIHLSALIQAV